MKRHFRRRWMACLAAGLVGSTCLRSAPADNSDLARRLDALEAQVRQLQQENAQLRERLGAPSGSNSATAVPAASNAAITVVPLGKESRLALGGFIHLNGEWGGAPDARFPENDRFFLRKVRLGVKGAFAEGLDFVLQAELGNNSLKEFSSYRVQATDVFTVWRAAPEAAVTLGQFKTPFGYEHLLPEVKTVAIERSLGSDLLTPGRQAGAMVSGEVLDRRMSYAVAATNGLSANNSYNDNEQFTGFARLAGAVFQREDLKVSIGGGAFRGRDDNSTFHGRRTGESVDAELLWGRAEVDAEWLRTRFHPNSGPEFDGRGWSVIGSYFVVPRLWQVFARYESYDPSSLDAADATRLRTVGVNYYLKGDDLKLSLNYLLGNPPGAAAHQDRLIARLQVLY